MIVTLLGRGRCVACGFGVQHSGNYVQNAQKDVSASARTHRDRYRKNVVAQGR